MSGRLGNYWELVKAAEQARVTITKAQQKQIAGLYQEISDDLNHRLQRYTPDSLTYRWVKDYAKSLQKDSKRLYTVIKAGVADSLLQSAKAPVKAEQTFYSKLAPELSEHFSDVFSRVPQSAADELMSGGIYKDFSGLSERIWNYRKKYNRDIQTVIVKGIEAQKSAFDLAKDLEMYVDPKAAKPWNWNIVYPGVNQVVDYNAQRLSRTAITHAYQLSFERATKDNPFVESYKWHSSHGARMCELCAQRDGRIYQKDALPFDHPNGMCTVTAVIPKSYDEIGQELGDWAAGKSDNPELDKWLLKSDKGNDKMSLLRMDRRDQNTGAFKNLQVPMQKRQVLQIARKYGLDMNGVTVKIQRSEALVALPYLADADSHDVGRIDLFPNAFQDEETMIKTLIHEKVHIAQYKRYGVKIVQEDMEHMEKQAYRLENIIYLALKKKVRS
ncbi:MAG: phage head morphogenesis protein [Clostridiales bacterium]|jgi:hypothetical protein|nr:phage head morphogenesis protein [Clostridiales bacterium]MCI1961111.1 phage head morphogenesis protein [Clostridiales bacterium]MCI2021552.1 phage head morphogenesis protein [Clostridiales bacterium]MCI2026338.1 phage head morphogenesis protein [Clostridiales bacterium]